MLITKSFKQNKFYEHGDPSGDSQEGSQMGEQMQEGENTSDRFEEKKTAEFNSAAFGSFGDINGIKDLNILRDERKIAVEKLSAELNLTADQLDEALGGINLRYLHHCRLVSQTNLRVGSDQHRINRIAFQRAFNIEYFKHGDKLNISNMNFFISASSYMKQLKGRVDI
jgi:hypothetical protein